MCQHNLPCSIVYAHCLLPGRAFASLYVLLFLEKEAEIGGCALVLTYLSVCLTYLLRTYNLCLTYKQYLGIRWLFLFKHNFLVLFVVCQRIPMYYSVVISCLKLMSNVFSVHQHTCLIYHTSAYVGAIRRSVTGPLQKQCLCKHSFLCRWLCCIFFSVCFLFLK